MQCVKKGSDLQHILSKSISVKRRILDNTNSGSEGLLARNKSTSKESFQDHVGSKTSSTGDQSENDSDSEAFIVKRRRIVTQKGILVQNITNLENSKQPLVWMILCELCCQSSNPWNIATIIVSSPFAYYLIPLYAFFWG
jgi:hypothetical protein